MQSLIQGLYFYSKLIHSAYRAEQLNLLLIFWWNFDNFELKSFELTFILSKKWGENYRLKIMYMSWKDSVWYRSANSCHTAEQENLEAWAGQLWWNDPRPPKNWKNKFVFKCILGYFHFFEQLFFLVENRPIQTPLLVENSTIFLKPSLIDLLN